MKKIIPLILSAFLISTPSHQGLAQSLLSKNESAETLPIYNSDGNSITMPEPAVKENVTSSIIASICTGHTYFLGTQAITTAGIYMQTFPAANNGDSIVTLYLTVDPNVTSTVSLTLCPDQLPAIWNGITIPSGTTSNTAFTTYSTYNTIGCDSTITLNLTIKQVEACCTLMMPNAFSPNGDGLNDKFVPGTNAHPSSYTMRIYNHWGKMIYVSHDIEQQWDGTYNGQPAAPGNYRYMITGGCANGQSIQMKGDVALVR
jgi:gliding motility-associated-like protein